VAAVVPVARPAGRRPSAARLLAGLAWAALLLQLVLTLRLAVANGKSPLAGLVQYLGYFTILSNLFIAIVATAGARRRASADDVPDGLYGPSPVGCATTAIAVVGLGYHVLLREAWHPQGLQWLADVLLHYVVPGAALLHWWAYPLRERIDWRSPLAWCAYPLGYFAYARLRGAWLGTYPYPFIDAAALGDARVAVNAAGLLVVFLSAGYVLVALARALQARRIAAA
jgi:hypothetical protein